MNDLQVGIAAEHLVCADLLIKGYDAFLSNQFCSYDVIIDHESKLYRIQVKATRKPKEIGNTNRAGPMYIFNMRRTKSNDRMYSKLDADLFAFVALDIRQIAYVNSVDLLNSKQEDLVGAVLFRSPSCEYPEYDTMGRLLLGTKLITQFPFEDAIRCLN